MIQGHQKLIISLSSCVSMIRLLNRVSKDMVGKYTSYLAMKNLCSQLSAHIFPFSFPLIFYFIMFIDHSAPLCCDFVILPGSISPIAFCPLIVCTYCTCLIFPFLLFLFILFLADIGVNVVSTGILCVSCMNYLHLPSVLMN